MAEHQIPELTAGAALDALNELRSNIIGTQSCTWSNAIYPLVAILNAAGMEYQDPDEEQMAQHFHCYGGAGGYPGHLQGEPTFEAKNQARRRMRQKEGER